MARRLPDRGYSTAVPAPGSDLEREAAEQRRQKRQQAAAQVARISPERRAAFRDTNGMSDEEIDGMITSGEIAPDDWDDNNDEDLDDEGLSEEEHAARAVALYDLCRRGRKRRQREGAARQGVGAGGMSFSAGGLTQRSPADTFREFGANCGLLSRAETEQPAGPSTFISAERAAMSFAAGDAGIVSDERAEQIVNEQEDNPQSPTRARKIQEAGQRKAKLLRAIRLVQDSLRGLRSSATIPQLATEVQRLTGLRRVDQSPEDFKLEVDELAKEAGNFAGGNRPAEVPPYIRERDDAGLALSVTPAGLPMSEARAVQVDAEMSRNAGGAMFCGSPRPATYR